MSRPAPLTAERDTVLATGDWRPRLRPLPAVSPVWDDGAGVVVVGTGAAGMSAALEAVAAGCDVLLLSKAELGGGSTPLAQGGLAAVRSADDSPPRHAADTAVAGAGLCRAGAVDALVAAAPGEIDRLQRLGARWDPGPPGLEGGHSRARIVHAGGDASGAEVHRVLAAATRRAAAGGSRAGRLRLAEHTVALDVVVDAGRVRGLRAARVGAGGRLEPGTIATGAVVLATGGFGQAWSATTNPEGSTGDGLALAARAGAEVVDVEFVQFHPTALWRPSPGARLPLVTEALRGAGAVLLDDDGRCLLAGVHPLADLAPRDVVAAAIHRHLQETTGRQHVWLDATGVGRHRLEEEFPTVTATCRALGLDPAAEPIPVAPAAHYACGGVRADLAGATSVPGLFAVGEVAATGVHGANRLASNSLTEALAAGRRLGAALADRTAPAEPATDLDPCAVTTSTPAGVAPAGRAALAAAMTAHAGVLRDGDGLRRLAAILDAAPPAPGGAPLDLPTLEATNLHAASVLVALAALGRPESRGCHRRSDHPAPDEAWRRHLVLRPATVTEPLTVGASA